MTKRIKVTRKKTSTFRGVVKGIVVFLLILFVVEVGGFLNKVNSELKETKEMIVESNEQIKKSNELIEDVKKKQVELDKKVQDVNTKVDREISSQKTIVANANKLLGGKLSGKGEQILGAFSNENIGKMVIAVSVAESSGGIHECGTYNYWGIFLDGKCANFRDLNHALDSIKKYTGKYYNEIDKLGVSHENLNRVFIGQGKYCVSFCNHWTSNTLKAYQSI